MHQSEVERAQERAEELRRELRAEVTSEIRGNLRRRAWRAAALRCGGCCGVYALGLVVAAAFLAVVVAKTGLVRIPFMSDRVAHRTAPLRVVAPASDADALRIARDALRRAGGRPPITATVPESVLTRMVRDALRDANPAIAESAQVAVRDGDVEVFGELPGVAGTTASLRVHGTVAVRGGRIAVEIREAMLGGVRLPSFLFGFVSDRLARPAPMFSVPLGRTTATFVVTAIAARDGALAVTFDAQPPAPAS